MIIALLIAFAFGVGVGALLQAHLRQVALLKRRARELDDHRRDD